MSECTEAPLRPVRALRLMDIDIWGKNGTNTRTLSKSSEPSFSFAATVCYCVTDFFVVSKTLTRCYAMMSHELGKVDKVIPMLPSTNTRWVVFSLASESVTSCGDAITPSHFSACYCW